MVRELPLNRLRIGLEVRVQDLLLGGQETVGEIAAIQPGPGGTMVTVNGVQYLVDPQNPTLSQAKFFPADPVTPPPALATPHRTSLSGNSRSRKQTRRRRVVRRLIRTRLSRRR